MILGALKEQIQTLCFKAATGNAFTIVRAGFAFTRRISPKISFLQALVAGLTRVLILQRPGKVKMPLFLTSCAPSSARLAAFHDSELEFTIDHGTYDPDIHLPKKYGIIREPS